MYIVTLSNNGIHIMTIHQLSISFKLYIYVFYTPCISYLYNVYLNFSGPLANIYGNISYTAIDIVTQGIYVNDDFTFTVSPLWFKVNLFKWKCVDLPYYYLICSVVACCKCSYRYIYTWGYFRPNFSYSPGTYLLSTWASSQERWMWWASTLTCLS